NVIRLISHCICYIYNFSYSSRS
ncbi:hypothetical protein MIMGU_mgv1a0247121mg, partial [Erythranthe guttata]